MDRYITIRTLEIDVVSREDRSLLAPADAESYSAFWAARDYHRTDDPVDHMLEKQMRPEWFCRWIKDHIGRMLWLDWGTRQYGEVFYERIGEIKILLDGELQDEFKVGEWLVEAPVGDPYGRDPWLRESRGSGFSSSGLPKLLRTG